MPIPEPPPVRLRQLAKLCASGDCPTVFVTDRDTVVIQGYTWTESVASPHSEGESLVEIPSELLLIAAQGLTSMVNRDEVQGRNVGSA